jgi:hypothetical protein
MRFEFAAQLIGHGLALRLLDGAQIVAGLFCNAQSAAALLNYETERMTLRIGTKDLLFRQT